MQIQNTQNYFKANTQSKQRSPMKQVYKIHKINQNVF